MTLVAPILSRGALVGTGRKRFRKRRSRPRSRTVSLKRLSRDVLRVFDAELEVLDVDASEEQRPLTRGDCSGSPRPCPFVSCRHHLYLDVNAETGSIRFNFPELEPHELAHSCSLDEADLGRKSLDEVGGLTNVTRERARQIEEQALAKLRHKTAQMLGRENPGKAMRAAAVEAGLSVEDLQGLGKDEAA